MDGRTKEEKNIITFLHLQNPSTSFFLSRIIISFSSFHQHFNVFAVHRTQVSHIAKKCREGVKKRKNKNTLYRV